LGTSVHAIFGLTPGRFVVSKMEDCAGLGVCLKGISEPEVVPRGDTWGEVTGDSTGEGTGETSRDTFGEMEALLP
jgi:hypothetical protein